MAVRQIPSALVGRLDADPNSPFFGLIRRSTTSKDPSRVITDSALVRTLQRQIHQPMGALASFRSLDGTTSSPNQMYEAVVRYWSEVKRAFPEAWGKPAEHSRLTHSAGIEALGALMDYLAPRASQQSDQAAFYSDTFSTIASSCAWTHGRWPDMNCAWNEIESTSRDIRRLSDQLVRLAQACYLRRVA